MCVYSFLGGGQVGASPLAMQLFLITGVRRVFFGGDFITITKHSDADWEALEYEANCLDSRMIVY